MDERHVAESQITQSRDHIGDLAEELSRRASIQYLGDRAKEKVKMTTHEWKDRTMEHPRTFQMFGAVGGWFLAKALFTQARARRVSQQESGTLQQQASAASETVRDKASSLMGSARSRASHMRESAADTWSSARERIPSWGEARGAIDSTVTERPLSLILGSVVIGAAAALLIPMTSRERKMLDPMRTKVRDTLHQATEAVDSKIASMEDPQPESPSPAPPY